MTYRRILTRLLVIGLCCIWSARVLSAEEMKGSFTLPEDTYWAGILLPAGQYTFRLDTTLQKPMLLYRSSSGEQIFQFVAYTEDVTTPAKSQLVIVHGAKQQRTVHILFIADAGTAFYFKVPHGYEVSSKVLASSSGPAEIEHVPVVISGN